jgi:hypothetical protein
VQVPFLVDTGADRTVFSAQILARLGLEGIGSVEQLGGVGGLAEAVLIDTVLHLPLEHGGNARFEGRYAALTSLEALDMSVLGRDITSRFALIVDWPGNTVCLINQNHRYAINAV